MVSFAVVLSSLLILTTIIMHGIMNQILINILLKETFAKA